MNPYPRSGHPWKSIYVNQLKKLHSRRQNVFGDMVRWSCSPSTPILLSLPSVDFVLIALSLPLALLQNIHPYASPPPPREQNDFCCIRPVPLRWQVGHERTTSYGSNCYRLNAPYIFTRLLHTPTNVCCSDVSMTRIKVYCFAQTDAILDHLNIFRSRVSSIKRLFGVESVEFYAAQLTNNGLICADFWRWSCHNL